MTIGYNKEEQWNVIQQKEILMIKKITNLAEVWKCTQIVFLHQTYFL